MPLYRYDCVCLSIVMTVCASLSLMRMGHSQTVHDRSSATFTLTLSAVMLNFSFVLVVYTENLSDFQRMEVCQPETNPLAFAFTSSPRPHSPLSSLCVFVKLLLSYYLLFSISLSLFLSLSSIFQERKAMQEG